MATVTIEVPDDAFSALRRAPKEFARDMRVAAAIQWYHQRLISQGKAAAIAGLTRRDFLMALHHAQVEASQVDIEEMKEDKVWKKVRPWPSLSPSGSAPAANRWAARYSAATRAWGKARVAPFIRSEARKRRWPPISLAVMV